MTKRVRPPTDLPLGPGASGSEVAGSSLSPAQTAEYVASLAGQLAELARKTGLDTLAHLLEMARFEAAAHMATKSSKTG
jgi:hypothetical protein